MDPDVVAHYSLGVETDRLVAGGSSRIEFTRTRELLERSLPKTPARILDVGGGPGWYASWLAGQGYDVQLIDLVPLHVEQATQRAAEGPNLSTGLGDAGELGAPNESADVVLPMFVHEFGDTARGRLRRGSLDRRVHSRRHSMD